MKPISILGVGLKSKSNAVTAQERVNCYLEESDDKSKVYAIGRPGLTLQTIDIGGATKIRAMMSMLYNGLNLLFIVADARFYQVVVSGGAFTSALISSSLPALFDGHCEFSTNGLEVVFTYNGYYFCIYNLSSGTFSYISSPPFPIVSGNYQSACFLDSFIIVHRPISGEVYWSASYDATSWHSLWFATAESNPDNVVRVFSNQGYLYVFGSESIEFWAADSKGLSVIKSLTLNSGLTSRYSVAKSSIGVLCLTKNEKGTSQISVVTPGNIRNVSTTDIDSIINQYSDLPDASGFCYAYNGHELYCINFTTSNRSFLYDITMNVWTEIKSNGGRYYGEKLVTIGSKSYVSDYRNNGRIYLIDPSVNTDNGDAIEMQITSKHIFNGLEKVSIKSLQIEAETGMLSDAGASITPYMTLLISKDKGNTFSTYTLSMGASGEYTKRIIRTRLGAARDWIFSLKITAAVKRIVLGAYVELN